jgi:hypothetical protein
MDLPYETLVDLWPNPEYKDYPESIDEERARLARDGNWIELVERTDYQRVIRYTDDGYIRVQGTEQDWLKVMNSTTSLSNAIKALQQIAFYGIMGARIPESFAHYFADAVNEMALAYENDLNAGIDDSSASKNCLNVLGTKLGILAGHRRPKAHYRVVGSYFERIFEIAWDEELDKLKADNFEELPPEEIHYLEDQAQIKARMIATEGIRELFELSDQQLQRYLDKWAYFRDHRKDPT